MVWYDADLEEEGVQALNRAFNSNPFSTRESQNEDYCNIEVVYEDGNRKTSLMSYDKDTIIIYHAVIDGLPHEIQEDIKRRLGGITSLDRVVERLRSYRQNGVVWR